MKTRLQLKTVISLRDDIESLISGYEESIIKSNTSFDVGALMNTLDALQDQLIIVKEVLQNANKAKNSGGKSNNYFIYRKANLEKRKKFLRRLRDSIGNNDHLAHFNKAYIKETQASIESEIKEIQIKLTKFNDSKKVVLEFNDTLVSLFPILQARVKK